VRSPSITFTPTQRVTGAEFGMFFLAAFGNFLLLDLWIRFMACPSSSRCAPEAGLDPSAL
jgi:hypothetical protein